MTPREVLTKALDERWRLMNAFTGNAFADGQMRDRIIEIDRRVSDIDKERVRTDGA